MHANFDNLCLSKSKVPIIHYLETFREKVNTNLIEHIKDRLRKIQNENLANLIIAIVSSSQEDENTNSLV